MIQVLQPIIHWYLVVGPWMFMVTPETAMDWLGLNLALQLFKGQFGDTESLNEIISSIFRLD